MLRRLTSANGETPVFVDPELVGGLMPAEGPAFAGTMIVLATGYAVCVLGGVEHVAAALGISAECQDPQTPNP